MQPTEALFRRRRQSSWFEPGLYNNNNYNNNKPFFFPKIKEKCKSYFFACKICGGRYQALKLPIEQQSWAGVIFSALSRH